MLPGFCGDARLSLLLAPDNGDCTADEVEAGAGEGGTGIAAGTECGCDGRTAAFIRYSPESEIPYNELYIL